MKEVAQQYLDDMLKVSTVSESSNGETKYVLGIYNNRVPVQGLYLKAKKDTPLERVEVKAKKRFSLETDPENYVQEARIIFFQQLEKYLNKYGVPKTEEQEKEMFGYVHNACMNTLSNIARKAKSNVMVYDSKTNTYSIMNLLSLNIEETNEEGDEVISRVEIEATNVIDTLAKESFNEFRIWFNENKSSFLTKRQLEYLEDKEVIQSKHRARINKTISERTYRKYTEDRLIKARIDKVKSKLKSLDNILDSKTIKDFMNNLVKEMKYNEWITDEVYTVSFETCAIITKACKEQEYMASKDNIMEIKKVLYTLYTYFSRVLDRLEECK